MLAILSLSRKIRIYRLAVGCCCYSPVKDVDCDCNARDTRPLGLGRITFAKDDGFLPSLFLPTALSIFLISGFQAQKNFVFFRLIVRIENEGAFGGCCFYYPTVGWISPDPMDRRPTPSEKHWPVKRLGGGKETSVTNRCNREKKHNTKKTEKSVGGIRRRRRRTGGPQGHNLLDTCPPPFWPVCIV